MRCVSAVVFAVFSLSVTQASEPLSKVSGYVTAINLPGTFDLQGVGTTPGLSPVASSSSPPGHRAHADDDQLATVLADNIARSLAKEYFRSRKAVTAKQIGSTATTAGVVLLWPAALAAGLVTQHVASSAIDKTVQQSGRVSLCLLHDAGYDIPRPRLHGGCSLPGHPSPSRKLKFRSAL